MAHISHFAHGFINPLMGFGFALSGSLLGLFCMVRARRAQTTGLRARRLVYATIALGGTGIWMMHFTAMIGFTVSDSEVRYDVGITALSLLMSIVSVGFGIFTVGLGRKSVAKVLIGGPLTGLGVVAMHYSGMGAVRINGTISYDPLLLGASVAIAVVAATVALAFAVWIEGRKPILVASVIMAIAVCGMHYTGMSAVRVALNDGPAKPVPGVDPILLLIPIMVLATGALIGLIFGLLGDEDEEETVLSPETPRSARHTHDQYGAASPAGAFSSVAVDSRPTTPADRARSAAHAPAASGGTAHRMAPPPVSDPSRLLPETPEPLPVRTSGHAAGGRGHEPSPALADTGEWPIVDADEQMALPRRGARIPRPRESGSASLALPPSANPGRS